MSRLQVRWNKVELMVLLWKSLNGIEQIYTAKNTTVQEKVFRFGCTFLWSIAYLFLVKNELHCISDGQNTLTGRQEYCPQEEEWSRQTINARLKRQEMLLFLRVKHKCNLLQGKKHIISVVYSYYNMVSFNIIIGLCNYNCMCLI